MLFSSPTDLGTTAPLIAFASVLAGSLGIPIPTLAAVIVLGSLLATQHGSLVAAAGVFAAAMVGAVIGDAVWFMAGRRYGNRMLSLICRLSLSRDSCVRRTADVFSRYGIRILLFDRFVPGLSVISAPLAGIAGVSLQRFLAFAETGAALWIIAGLALGYVFADQVGAILLMLEHFGLDLGGLAVALIAAFVFYRWCRRVWLLHRLRMARISGEQLRAMWEAGDTPVIIDVRASVEREADPFIIPGARFLDEHDETGIPILHPVVIYCSCPNEISAAIVAQQMRRRGFTDVRPLLGGLDAWRDAGHPVERVDPPALARAAE